MRLIFLFICLAAAAQTTNLPLNTNIVQLPPVLPPMPTVPINPLGVMALIPIIVPVLITLCKTLIPKIPTVALPVLAPAFGALIDIVLHYAGASTHGPFVGALLGAAGVGVRELVDQLKQMVKAPVPPAA